ncbi:MAG TPA: dienelactone hydrolase family protein [Candidatus Lustribacter sp.]|nr:dienelactone hydrolase family protein [Candidatus Lustribacter sp.]
MSTSAAEIHESRPLGKRGTPALMCSPAATGSYPCVMILHERYGLVPHTEDLARRLAAAGFVVIAPDLFHDFADIPALRAGTTFARPSDAEVLAACEDVFPNFAMMAGADTGRFAMIGVCQTGRYPLVWAAHHPIKAAVTLYGAAYDSDWERTDLHPDGLDGLIDKMGARKDGTAVLGIFGEGDFLISVPNVQRFRNALEDRNLSYQITIYPAVPHGWLNDTMPGRYRPEPAAAAWDEIETFLKAKLAPGANGHNEISWTFRSAKSVNYDFTKAVREA